MALVVTAPKLAGPAVKLNPVKLEASWAGLATSDAKNPKGGGESVQHKASSVSNARPTCRASVLPVGSSLHTCVVFLKLLQVGFVLLNGCQDVSVSCQAGRYDG